MTFFYDYSNTSCKIMIKFYKKTRGYFYDQSKQTISIP